MCPVRDGNNETAPPRRPGRSRAARWGDEWEGDAMIERSDLHTDCERMTDGTQRWLWRVVYQGRLYAGGVCQSRGYATHEAQIGVRRLLMGLDRQEERALGAVSPSPMLDPDVLDRGTGMGDSASSS